jgi:hypothetical protein
MECKLNGGDAILGSNGSFTPIPLQMRLDVAGSGLALLLVCAAPASAQRASEDSLARRSSQDPELLGWVSLGGGISKFAFASGFAGRIGINLSAGRYLAMYRGSVGIEDLESSDVTEVAGLVGVRTAGRGGFQTIAGGLSRVQWSGECKSSFSPCLRGTETAFAFDFGAHAHKRIAGFAGNIYGAVGPKNTRFLSATLSLELGWFGR